MNLSDILWMIDNIEPDKRETFLDHIGQRIEDVKAYHVTSPGNAEKIRTEGLKAQSSRQSYDRPDAVYFFLDQVEIDDDNKAILLDDPNSAEIIEVIIPRDEFLRKSKWDGLYNVSFGASRSAIQFFGDIPVDWLK